MPRYDLMIYTGTLKEYQPYKPKHRTLCEVLGISGIDLAIIITFLICVTTFLILFVRWWTI